LKTKLGKTISKKGRYSIVELENSDGELIGYIVLSPEGLALRCTSTIEEALEYVNGCIDLDDIGSEPVAIKAPKP